MLNSHEITMLAGQIPFLASKFSMFIHFPICSLVFLWFSHAFETGYQVWSPRVGTPELPWSAWSAAWLPFAQQAQHQFRWWLRFQMMDEISNWLNFRYDIMKFDGSEYAPCQVHETSMYALSTVPILQFTLRRCCFASPRVPDRHGDRLGTCCDKEIIGADSRTLIISEGNKWQPLFQLLFQAGEW